MKVMIFEGGESVDADNNHEVDDWSLESIQKAFIEYFGEDWATESTEDMFVDGEKTLLETITIVNDRVAQAVTCGVDGGMTYLIRCEQ